MSSFKDVVNFIREINAKERLVAIILIIFGALLYFLYSSKQTTNLYEAYQVCFLNRKNLQKEFLHCKTSQECGKYKFILLQYKCEEMFGSKFESGSLKY